MKKSSRSNKQRQQIAAEAARIMATEGQKSYLVAKQKAAERLAAPTKKGLPSNVEVENELRIWQQLYGGESLAEQLKLLRQGAIKAMRFMAPFNPRLVGPVLDGTADGFSRICLHVFSDDPDAVVHHLMEHGIPFEQERRRIRWHDGAHRHIDVVVVQAGDDTVEMSLMIGRDALQPPLSPVDGQPIARANLDDVEALLANP
ncbi:MAG: hypothetical protein ACXIUB_11755 [Wenzhouxiangella sp.]